MLGSGPMATKPLPALLIPALLGLTLGSGSLRADGAGSACCSDLEARIAELEAVTARKGGRRVAVTVSGQVSHVLMGWSDGGETNAYVVENNATQNRIGFQGMARIAEGWSAGFRLEFQPRAYRSSFANQLSLGASNNQQIATYETGSASLRHAHWILESQRWGTLTLGRNFEAAFGTSTVSLVNPDGFAGFNGPGFANGGFFLRRAGTAGNSGLSALTWQNFAYIRNGDGPTPLDYSHTSAHVRYTSPFLFGSTKSTGFQVSANGGADDAWTAALRYTGEHGPFRLAAAAGYSDWSGIDRGMCSLGAIGNNPAGGNPVVGSTNPATDAPSNVRCNGIQASASLLHVPSGLYVSGGGGQFHDRQADLALRTRTAGTLKGADDKSGAWWVQAGWQARLTTIGNTVFWGQFVAYDTGFGVLNNIPQTLAAGDVLNSLGSAAFITGTQTSIWGGGISQEITDAAMTLYAGVHTYATGGTLQDAVTGTRRAANAIDGFQVFYSGATIRF